MEPRHARLAERTDALQANIRQQQADQPARDGEHEAFGQQLPDDAPAAGAEGGAHGHFFLPRERTRQQQVRHIRAGDEQNERD